MIFQEVVGDRSALTLDYFRIPKELRGISCDTNKDAYRLTHVCKLWKDRVFSQPLLWNTIMTVRGTKYKPANFVHPRLLQALQLSGDAPLNIRIEHLSEIDLALVQNFAARCHDIRTLRLDTDGGPPDRLSLFSDSAPLLERLYLSGTAMTAPPMFRNDMPRLKHLALRSFLWSSSPNCRLTTLTHLTLASQTYSNPEHSKGVISLLRASQNSLREVCFENCRLVQQPQARGALNFPLQPVISLPMLKQLAFRSCDAVVITAILAHISTPEQGVALDLHMWEPETVSITSLLPPQAHTRLKFLQNVFTAVDASLDHGNIVASSDTSSIRYRSSFSSRIRDEMPQIGHLFPFAALQTLCLRFTDNDSLSWVHITPWTVGNWQVLFAALTSLTRLFVGFTRDDVKPLLLALRPSDDVQRPRPTPLLRELWICPPAMDKNSDALLSMLARRQAMGLRVRLLRVIHEDFGLQSPFYKSEPRSVIERKGKTFRAWEARREEFARYVDEVEFEVVGERISVDTPTPFLRPLFLPGSSSH